MYPLAPVISNNSIIQPNENNVWGNITITPALNHQEIQFLQKYIKAWHKRDDEKLDQGLYSFGVSNRNITKNTTVPIAQPLEQAQEFVPSMPCCLELTSTDNWNPNIINALTVKNTHKRRDTAAQWIKFFIDHFFAIDAIAKQLKPEEFGFFKKHQLNGKVWVKNLKAWTTHCIEVRDNVVFDALAFHPIEVSRYNGFDTIRDTFGVHQENFKDILSQEGIKSDKSSFYQQFILMDIRTIVKFNKCDIAEEVKAIESELLNKLILNAQLKQQLVIKNSDSKKVVKI